MRVVFFASCFFRNFINSLNSFSSSLVHGLSRTVRSTFLGSLISPIFTYDLKYCLINLLAA